MDSKLPASQEGCIRFSQKRVKPQSIIIRLNPSRVLNVAYTYTYTKTIHLHYIHGYTLHAIVFVNYKCCGFYVWDVAQSSSEPLMHSYCGGLIYNWTFFSWIDVAHADRVHLLMLRHTFVYSTYYMHIWCCLFGRSVLGAFRAYIVLVVKKGSGFSGPVWMYVCVWYNKYRKWSADGAHDFIHKQVRGGFADCRDSWGFFPFMNGAQWGR